MSDDFNWRAAQMVRDTQYLMEFIHESLDQTEQRLEELKEQHEKAQDPKIEAAIEQLIVEARSWARTAKDLLAQLLLKSKEVSVLLEKVSRDEPGQRLKDKVRVNHQTLRKLLRRTLDNCLEALGRGHFLEIQESVETTEQEAETEKEAEFDELQNDLEEMVDIVDNQDHEVGLEEDSQIEDRVAARDEDDEDEGHQGEVVIQ